MTKQLTTVLLLTEYCRLFFVVFFYLFVFKHIFIHFMWYDLYP